MIDRFEQFVSYISAIHRDVQKIERDEMEKCGLKGAHAQYLVAMHRFPDGITAAELCDVCGKDKAAGSEIWIWKAGYRKRSGSCRLCMPHGSYGSADCSRGT